MRLVFLNLNEAEKSLGQSHPARAFSKRSKENQFQAPNFKIVIQQTRYAVVIFTLNSAGEKPKNTVKKRHKDDRARKDRKQPLLKGWVRGRVNFRSKLLGSSPCDQEVDATSNSFTASLDGQMPGQIRAGLALYILVEGSFAHSSTVSLCPVFCDGSDEADGAQVHGREGPA